MLLSVPVGTTSKDIIFPVFDSSSTVGALLAGLVYNTGSLVAYYTRQGVAGSPVSISLATKTKGTWATGGFVTAGTGMTGWYELGIPDAALAAGATWVAVTVAGAANMVPVCLLIELTAVSNQDAVHGGMTALPNAVAGASGGVLLVGTGTGALNVSGGVGDTNITKIDGASLATHYAGEFPADVRYIAGAIVSTTTAQLGVNAVQHGGTAQTGRDIGASVLISSGTGTGQLSVASGVIAANVTQIDGSVNGTHATGMIPADCRDILGTAISAPATAGILDVNVKNMNNVAATSITTISAYQGSTQPHNWTGTGATAYLKTDMVDILGTAVSTPATSGVLDVNVKNMNNVAATSITTINANQGTTQPVNFTGTGASAYAKADMVDIAGAAVSTTTAQVGANVVQLSADATAADNAESFFDGTGYAGTNNTIPTVTTVNGFGAGAITNAAFNDDVNTTSYSTNKLALMLYKFFDNAFTGLADGTTFTANGLLDRLAKAMWILRNKIAVTDANGNTIIYKDNSTDAAFTVSSMLTDDSTTTTRLRAA